MYKFFFRNHILPPKSNHTFLALTPKKPDANKCEDFRPISLCNVLYKIISKLIAKRLKPLLDGLISSHQNAFIPGRHISDNLVVALEVMHTMRKMPGSHSAFAFKVDIAKAYDHISWEVLE